MLCQRGSAPLRIHQLQLPLLLCLLGLGTSLGASRWDLVWDWDVQVGRSVKDPILSLWPALVAELSSHCFSCMNHPALFPNTLDSSNLTIPCLALQGGAAGSWPSASSCPSALLSFQPLIFQPIPSPAFSSSTLPSSGSPLTAQVSHLKNN